MALTGALTDIGILKGCEQEAEWTDHRGGHETAHCGVLQLKDATSSQHSAEVS